MSWLTWGLELDQVGIKDSFNLIESELQNIIKLIATIGKIIVNLPGVNQIKYSGGSNTECVRFSNGKGLFRFQMEFGFQMVKQDGR